MRSAVPSADVGRDQPMLASGASQSCVQARFRCTLKKPCGLFLHVGDPFCRCPRNKTPTIYALYKHLIFGNSQLSNQAYEKQTIQHLERSNRELKEELEKEDDADFREAVEEP